MPPALIAGATAAAEGASSGSKKGPSGQTTTTSQVSDPVYRDYLGRIQSGFDTNNLGTNQPALSPQTQLGLNTTASLADPNGASSNALRYALGLTGSVSQNNFNNTAYAPLAQWAVGNFSGSPGYSGLAATAAGSFLPSSVPGVTYGSGGIMLPGSSSGTMPGTIGISGSGNPFLDNLVTQAADKAQGAVNASFAGNERFGSGANASALTSNVMNGVSSILSPIYQQERANQLNAQQILGGAQGNAANTLGGVQMGAVNMLPTLDAAQFLDPSMLQQVGQVYDTRAYNDANRDYLALKNASGLLGVGGGPTSTSQPYWTNPFAGILGSALAGGGNGGLGRLFGGGDTTGGANTNGIFGANGLFGSYGPIRGSGEQFGPTSASIPAGGSTGVENWGYM